MFSISLLLAGCSQIAARLRGCLDGFGDRIHFTAPPAVRQKQLLPEEGIRCVKTSVTASALATSSQWPKTVASVRYRSFNVTCLPGPAPGFSLVT